MAKQNTVKEEWRKIKDRPLYSVSNLGRVKKDARFRYLKKTNKWSWTEERIKIPAISLSGGYLVVSLCTGIKGEMVVRKVHRLVYEAFVGTIPPDMVIMHIDDNPKNASLINLKLGTQIENVKDMWKKKRGYTTVSVEDVISILARRADGQRCQELADMFGCSKHVVKKISQRRNWSWIPEYLYK